MSVTYKIGEAASLLHLKTYVLRFWETEFPQIAPLRTEKGQRLYTEEHLAILDRIRFLLHDRGLTIEGARKILAEEAGRGLRYMRPGIAPHSRPAPVPPGSRGKPGISVSGRGRRVEPPASPPSSRRESLEDRPDESQTGDPFPFSVTPGRTPAAVTSPLVSSHSPFFPDREPADRRHFPPGADSLAESALPAGQESGVQRREMLWREILEDLEAVAELLRGVPPEELP
jgi:DNA-binding transcriptional MerR regulator